MACNCSKFKKKLNQLKQSSPDKMVYLDYNATTPVDPRVLGAMDRACRNLWANPSSLHACGLTVDNFLTHCGKTIAEYLKIAPEGIHYCGSASEAIHGGIHGILKKDPGRQLIITEIEHSAVYHPARLLKSASKNDDFVPKSSILRVDSEGKIDLDDLEALLQRGPALFVYSPVNHETGSLQNIKDIYQLASHYDCLVFLDAVQAAARLAPEDWTPYCDLFALSGHKIYTPKGIALLWIKGGIPVRPFRFGGSQEAGLFPGTQNVPGIASLAESIKIMQKEFPQERQYLTTLTTECLRILEKQEVPFFKETPEKSTPGILNLSFPWVKDMEHFLYSCNENNICLSRFSACADRLTGPSKILTKMGRSADRTHTTVRLSFGRWTKRDDLFKFSGFMTKYRKKSGF